MVVADDSGFGHKEGRRGHCWHSMAWSSERRKVRITMLQIHEVVELCCTSGILHSCQPDGENKSCPAVTWDISKKVLFNFYVPELFNWMNNDAGGMGWMSGTSAFLNTVQRFLPLLWCRYMVCKLSIFARMNGCWFAQWRWESSYVWLHFVSISCQFARFRKSYDSIYKLYSSFLQVSDGLKVQFWSGFSFSFQNHGISSLFLWFILLFAITLQERQEWRWTTVKMKT